MIPLHNPRTGARIPLLALVLSLVASSACTGGYAIAHRETAALGSPAWFAPVATTDRTALDKWSAAVGPPVVPTRVDAGAVSSLTTLCVVSWNTALGDGDAVRFIERLRRSHPDTEVVLLLQEVFRKGPEVPRALTVSASFASKLGHDSQGRRRDEIETVAERTGLHLYYVPSMRNGGPSTSDEDRGNAILSSLPLTDLTAIELPFERQRRVAVAASISGRSRDGLSWRLRVVSAHLDNLVGARRGWFAGAQFGRIRQARALLDYLREDDAVVLAGDFNTWFGFRERAYAEVLSAFPQTTVSDRRGTFRGLLRLDHIFFRLPNGWHGEFRRAAETYGSDHYPLIATIALP